MANLRDIRRRIKSVKNTAQITRAMQLVAAAKMKKAQDQALAGRDYATQLNGVLQDISEGFSETTHPLLEKREGNRELVLVISTDKGLCGPLNTNLSRKLRDAVSPDADYVTVGRKLRIMLEKLGKEIIADFSVKDPVPFADARAIAKLLAKQFLDGKYDKVSIAYTRFVNTLSQTPEIVQLLPVEPPTGYADATDTNEYLFEPTTEEVLGAILPLYVNFRVFQALVESRASEHSARMVAMKAATDNAKKFIKELTLEYNKLRQGAITAELLEITTAMKAME
ncbi:ATP synthase F1 subunit gamma [Luteolibacter sp. SL250]|uniref:ATP synthase F1 subunit gamma n=1 Tax=Luteolibacter sp. SL250 TaxID=2995170 RepID=UPI00226E2C06|nr:ATP synthase F1 subunit gamma [Luteolibacter sp. SL250]WAC20273.1 ATP synthase F1 subunit gamma [Luteolibacter sp. SL250]